MLVKRGFFGFFVFFSTSHMAGAGVSYADKVKYRLNDSYSLYIYIVYAPIYFESVYSYVHVYHTTTD